MQKHRLILLVTFILFNLIALSIQDEGKCTKPPEDETVGQCGGAPNQQKSKYTEKRDTLEMIDFMPSESFWNNHLYHISSGQNNPQYVQALIEIPKGSRAKFEVDEDSGLLKLDRVLYNAIHYPSHYGFIPSTMAGDRDPLDILVLCSEKVPPLTLIDARVIGVIQMIDGDEEDDKIIAVAMNDPKFLEVNDINDVSRHTIQEIEHFFEDYKRRIGIEVVLEKFQGREQAYEIINNALKYYQDLKSLRKSQQKQ
ncbi:hypothetical protein ABPG74_008178 [Tetrahymena malaccensis]